MATMTTPRRRWFRFAFSLRTLFVVVTLLACGLGYGMWQWRIVQERKTVWLEALLGWKAGGGEFRHVSRDERASRQAYIMDGVIDSEDLSYLELPWIWRCLGAEPYYSLTMPDSVDLRLIEQIEYVFPEASIMVTRGSESTVVGFRDSLYEPIAARKPNTGTIFKTGLIEK